jgi:hypothetical protein
MWDSIEQIRNKVAGYEPETVQCSRYDQRMASRMAMRRLYARRRKMGLNAHGKPFKVRQRTNRQNKLNL